MKLKTRRVLGDRNHYWVKGKAPGKTHDETYVAFSGFFGSYNVKTFARAPEMLKTLESMVRTWTQGRPFSVDQIGKAQKLIEECKND